MAFNKQRLNHKTSFNKIQVAYNLSEGTTRQREVTALTKIANVLPCKRRTIITYDTKDTITDAYGKIEVLPCWKWLLS